MGNVAHRVRDAMCFICCCFAIVLWGIRVGGGVSFWWFVRGGGWWRMVVVVLYSIVVYVIM